MRRWRIIIKPSSVVGTTAVIPESAEIIFRATNEKVAEMAAAYYIRQFVGCRIDEFTEM